MEDPQPFFITADLSHHHWNMYQNVLAWTAHMRNLLYYMDRASSSDFAVHDTQLNIILFLAFVFMKLSAKSAPISQCASLPQ